MRPHILVPLLLLTLLCAAPAGAAPAAPATEHAPSSLYDSSSPTMPAGAISVHPYAHEQLADGDSLDDYDSEPLTSIADPLEPWNRFWFAFNDIFFLHVAKPVYNFYETVVPQPIRGGVKNFYANILMPKRMINSLLQFRVKEAFVEFGRFCMNTTVGLGGFADVASRSEEHTSELQSRHRCLLFRPSLGAGHGFRALPALQCPGRPAAHLREPERHRRGPVHRRARGLHPVPRGARQTLIRRHLDDRRGKEPFPQGKAPSVFQTRRAGALPGPGRPTQQPGNTPPMNLDDTLTLEQLSVSFSTDDGILPAVHAVSLSLPPAGITCLVGESGCGKSLTARAILHLLPENAHISGRILFRGRDLRTMPPEEMRALRGRHIAMIFQEPMTSLNPVLKVGMQTAEPLRLHLGLSRSEARQEVIRLFSEVGIPAAESRYDDYPHQLSGGMRQRVMIAMALACKPDLLLADEPTTALDATIQGQILSLITEQSRKRGMAVLFITHDLGVVARIADNVGVMYAGHLVEHAPTAELFRNPLHPYTRGLMRSAPGRAAMGMQRLPAITGSVPSLDNMPEGCPFAPRCDEALPRCFESAPVARCENGHSVACWAV